MAQQVYCSNCGSTTNPKVAGSIMITLILVWFAIVPAVIYEIWRGKNKRCRQCGSPATMPLHSPAAQQAIQRQQVPIQQAQLQPLPIPAPVAPPEPTPDLPLAETFAIDQNISGGLIEFFGLQRWDQADFVYEQKHRIE